MSLLSRLNKKALAIFLQTEAWLLLVALVPAAVYGYTDGLWVSVKVFLAISLVITLGLLWAFWGVLFPKATDGS
jgi:hypothetical protein